MADQPATVSTAANLTPWQHRKSEARIRWQDLALAGLSSGLLILSFPKAGLDFFAWVGLAPLFISLDGKKPQTAFLLCFLSGWGLYTGIFYWIWTLPSFNLLDYLLLATYLSIFLGTFGLILGYVRSRTNLSLAFVAPPLWVVLEYIRSHAGFLGVPWMLLGHSQFLHPTLIQITALTGVYGLSFLIVLVNAVVAEIAPGVRSSTRADLRIAAARFRPVTIALVITLLGGSLSYGRWILSDDQAGEELRVSVVQGNIPQDQKWDQAFRTEILNKYISLTRVAARDAPALIIWPETAVPGDVQHSPVLLRALGGIAHEAGSYLLVGSSATAKFSDKKLAGKEYNSLVLLSPDGAIAGEYRKQILVPFGEYIPLRGTVRWSEAIATPRQDILAGNHSTLFTMGPLVFGATICWENVFPDLFRDFVQGGARLMINATNEAWFGETAASYQFLAMSVFRAAENRVAVVRSTNTGISAFIDPHGKIIERLIGADGKALFVEGVLTGTVQLSRGLTFYARYGDVFTFGQVVACVLMLCYALLIDWRRKSVSHPRHALLREEER